MVITKQTDHLNLEGMGEETSIMLGLFMAINGLEFLEDQGSMWTNYASIMNDSPSNPSLQELFIEYRIKNLKSFF